MTDDDESARAEFDFAYDDLERRGRADPEVLVTEWIMVHEMLEEIAPGLREATNAHASEHLPEAMSILYAMAHGDDPEERARARGLLTGYGMDADTMDDPSRLTKEDVSAVRVGINKPKGERS